MLRHLSDLLTIAIGLSFAGLCLLFLMFASAGPGSPPRPVEAQTCTGDPVCDPNVRASSRSPGARTGYEVTFVTPVDIEALTGSIVMELDEDIRAPRSISSFRVRVQYRTDDERVGGLASDVSLIDQDNYRRPTTINIAHRLRSNNSQVAIPAGAAVTVTFSREAGIANPTEGGSYTWKVGVGSGSRLVNANHPEGEVREAFRLASAEGEDTGLLVDRKVQLSRQEASRGQSVTVTARGYREGRTLTVWRDANLDGQRDTGEWVLCQVVVANAGTGRCDFTVAVPPFAGAFGECKDRSALNCNFVNAAEGSGGSSIIIGRDSDLIFQADQALELVGRVLANTVQGPGGHIQLELVDFPAGVVTAVDIGGVPAEIDPLTVGTSTTLFFSVPVPDAVRLGRQYLVVTLVRRDNGEKFTGEIIVDITHPNTVVRINPDTVLANQRVALSGQGFSEADSMIIDEVRFGSFVVDPSRVNNGAGRIGVAGDGSWSGFVDLPIVEATTVQGTHLLRVRDSRGRTGSVEVNVAPREVTVTPVWGRPGSIVTVSGRGFPSRNDHGSSVVVRITYDASDRFAAISTETDHNGNFSQDIRIPLQTATPSSNIVRVEFDDDNGVTVATTTRHEVPATVVELNPASGPPGTPVTMRGSGFRHHVPVESVLFDEIDLTPGNAAATDAIGEFLVEFLVPGLEVGQHTVQATAAGATASSTFDITVSGVTPGAPSPVAEAWAGLGVRLLRVFHFNNDTKEWTFYDPELEDLNTLGFMVAGETYLVLISETNGAVLNGKPRDLTCKEGNCWNHIVW